MANKNCALCFQKPFPNEWDIWPDTSPRKKRVVMFTTIEKMSRNENKKLFLTMFLAAGSLIFTAAGCNTWNPNIPVSGTPTTTSTVTATQTATNTPSNTPTATSAAACPNPAAVGLGQAGNYVILAETGITNIPSSAVTGDIANSGTGAQITGLTCPEVNGVIYTIDAAGPPCRTIDATNIGIAVTDKGNAYTTANGLADCVINQSAGILSGLTLTRGKYFFNTGVSVPTDLHLDALGDPTARWVFQVNGTFTMASAVTIYLDNGALASNVIWTVTGFTQIGMNAHFEGVLIGFDYIQLITGASAHGRLLTHTYVALDQNVVTQLP
jgi:hypothetical protein